MNAWAGYVRLGCAPHAVHTVSVVTFVLVYLYNHDEPSAAPHILRFKTERFESAACLRQFPRARVWRMAYGEGGSMRSGDAYVCVFARVGGERIRETWHACAHE